MSLNAIVSSLLSPFASEASLTVAAAAGRRRQQRFPRQCRRAIKPPRRRKEEGGGGEVRGVCISASVCLSEAKREQTSTQTAHTERIEHCITLKDYIHPHAECAPSLSS